MKIDNINLNQTKIDINKKNNESLNNLNFHKLENLNINKKNDFKEVKVDNVDFTYDIINKTFVSKIKLNDIVLSQYPTEEMLNLKKFLNSKD